MDVREHEMQAPLRVVFIEHGRENYGIAAQLLSEHHLNFSRQCAGSALQLSEIAENFKPHIVLCTDDISTDSNPGVLEVLRLLCSQTPAILVEPRRRVRFLSRNQRFRLGDYRFCRSNAIPGLFALDNFLALRQIDQLSERQNLRATAAGGSYGLEDPVFL